MLHRANGGKDGMYVAGGEATLEALVSAMVKDKLLKHDQRFSTLIRNMEVVHQIDKTNLFKKIEQLDHDNRQLTAINQHVGNQLNTLFAMIQAKFGGENNLNHAV